MEIKKINLTNFKCFKSATIDLEKITLLTGPNSSGKSSLIYPLLAVMQTNNFPFKFSTSGKYVNLGDFKDIIYGQKLKLNFSINLSLQEGKNNAQINTVWCEDKKTKLPILKSLVVDGKFFTLNIKPPHSKKNKYHLSFQYYSDKDYYYQIVKSQSIERAVSIMMKSMAPIFPEKNKIKKISPIVRRIEKIKTAGGFNFDDVDKLSFRTQRRDEYIFLDRILGEVKGYFRSLDEYVNFISSFRNHPERTYYQTASTNLKVGKSGENYIDQVLSWELEKSSELKRLVSIMRQLKLLSVIKTRRMTGGRFEVIVRVRPKSVISSLTDVGFGISQFLPFLVADLQLKKNSTLLVSQPEIHLHPSSQALIANYLVDSIKNNNKNYIIETHSEYLLNRIRLLIVKGELETKDLSVYFLENNGQESVIHKIEFTKSGQIINAPDEFFNTYLMDTLDIALKA